MIKTLIASLALLTLVSAHKHSDKTPLVYGIFSEECYNMIS
jgi:hypothetical protein